MTALWPLRHLILYKAWADFRAESQRMYLGVVWWILDPLLRLIVYYLAFGIIMDRGGPGFIPVLITGITPWQLFNSVVQRTSGSVGKGAGIIHRSPVPRGIFPVCSIVEGFIESVFRFVAMFGMLFFYGIWPTQYWIALVPLFVVQMVLISGVSLPLASIVPFFPDLGKVIGYALRLMFFLSGVFYRIDQLNPEVQFFVRLNPMAFLIESYRDAILDQAWPQWKGLWAVMGIGVFGAVLGLWIIDKMGGKYAKRTTV